MYEWTFGLPLRARATRNLAARFLLAGTLLLAVQPAVGPARAQSGGDADEDAPRPGAEVFSGAFWKTQGFEQILAPWTIHAADTAQGAYFAELSRDWTPNPSAQKYPGMIGRHVFSYAAAYLMSGQEEHLHRASDAVDFMVAHGWDERYGGWYNAVDRSGAVTDSSKDVFMQVYAATGLALYYAVTHSERALRYLERTNRMLETRAWDAERGGYVRSLQRDLSIKEPFKDFSPQLAPLSGYLLFMYQATREDAYLRQAERIMAVVLERMRDAETGWVLERFSRDWQFLPEDARNRFVNVGHNIEVAWVLLRLYLITEKSAYRRAARSLSRQLTQHAFHEQTGAWAHHLNADRPAEQEATAPWWVQAYGNMLQLYLYRVTESEPALERFEKGARFWNEHFVDARYGGAVLMATREGRLAHGEKGVRTKTSYHAMEHALLNYLLTRLWVEDAPATLYFRIAGSASGQKLYPSLVEGDHVRLRRAVVNGREQAPSHQFVLLPDGDTARVEAVLVMDEPVRDEPAMGSSAGREATPAADSLFDLVILGEGFAGGTHRAFLKTNPGIGAAWEAVGRFAASSEEARPHAPENTANRLLRLLRNRPLDVRRRSLSHYVRPRPVALTPAAPSASSGTFALQGHNPDSKVYYRKVRVRPLPN